MALNHQKELTPVLYNADGLKIIKWDNLPPNFLIFNMHWHERIEFILVTSGSFHFRLKNYETILSENQLAIVPPGQLHYGMAKENGVSFKTLMFDISTFYTKLPATERFLKPIVEQKVTFKPWTDHSEIIALIKSIMKDTLLEDPLSSLSKIGKIYELISLLYQHCMTEEEMKPLSTTHFQDVLDYINEHFTEDISSAELSKRFGYSEGYFCRQFKTVTGLTPMIYIRILRLEKAREMLKNRQFSFSEIAMHCGFSNANYFTRCFKSHFDLTPSEYVQQCTH